MKIGILTLPIAENYGGILQATALYTLLAQKGHTVTLLYKPDQSALWKRVIRFTLIKMPFQNIKNVRRSKQEWKARRDLHKPFIQNEIKNISPNLPTTTKLKKYNNTIKFDAIIVGSDQVWRKAYIKGPFYKSYFLDFVSNNRTKKIAYAASFGTQHWEGKKDANQISNLLKQFTAISVREKSGIDICHHTFNINNVIQVLDPTLLMPKEYYLTLIKKYLTTEEKEKKSPKLVSYILDNSLDKKELLNVYQEKLHLKDEEISHLKQFNSSHVTYTIPQWLHAISKADFIITDSFHGMVFSIIFQKNFIVIGNINRGLDRFKSLLSQLELERLLVLESEIKNFNLDSYVPIDYVEIQKKLDRLKSTSLAFLFNNL